MKLLFLFGRPAVGKLTVAREVARLTGGRLFHNHVAVNAALARYEFGTPGFVALREEIWNAEFRRSVAEGLPLLIFTFNPENTVPQRFIDELFSHVAASGGEVIPVELVADEAEIEARIGSESRRREGKTLDGAAYRKLRAAGAFDSPRIPAVRLVLDTGRLKPDESAGRIAAIL